MPSTYTTSLRLTLPATGELAGVWGNTVNNGITQLVEASIAGTASVAMTDADYTLTTANGAADESRKMFITLTGALTATRNVICPAVSKLYFVQNNTSGAQDIVFKTPTGTGVTVANGKIQALYCDGTNVVPAVVSGGGSGPGSNLFCFENDITVTANYTITAGKNAMSAGPITVNSGVVVTVPSGSVWTVV